MAEPNPTDIRGGLLALVSANPRTSLAVAPAALLRAARLVSGRRSAGRPPSAFTAGVLLTLLAVAWL